MSKKISIDLFKPKSIHNAISEIQAYRDTLPIKVQIFVNKLADYGISVGYSSISGTEYTGYIEFTKTYQNISRYSAISVVIGKNVGQLQKSYFNQGHVVTVDVNAILMAEFGSGFKARNERNISGVGQGTFPGQKHAFDQNGWWWTTPDGVRHHSNGERAYRPIQRAYDEMMLLINTTIQEVFGQ